MKYLLIIAIISLLVLPVFAESKPPNYISEFRKNPNKEIFSALLKAKVKTEKEAEKIALNWLGKNHGLLAEEVLIVSGLYKISGSANKPNKSGYWIWEIRVTEMTMMLSGVILINSKDGAVDGTILKDGKLSCANDFAIIKQRQKTVNQLIANFKKSNDKDYKRSVMYALGQLRAIKAIPLLIKNIRYGNYGSIRGNMPQYGVEPAANALSRIGIPAIAPILNAIKKINDHFTVCYLCNALVDINGYDLAVFYLEKEIDKTKDYTDKTRLEKALKLIACYAPKCKKNETFVYGKPIFGFALAIKPQIKKHDFGYVVFAVVRIKNVSNKESSVIIHNFTLQYFFEVTDLAGKKIPKLLYQKDIDRKIKEGLSFLRIFGQKVKPGEFLEYKLNLSKRFDLTMGSSYIVQGYRDIRKYDPINKKRSHSKVFSSKVKFSIK